jgi:hypothetical protein
LATPEDVKSSCGDLLYGGVGKDVPEHRIRARYYIRRDVNVENQLVEPVPRRETESNLKDGGEYSAGAQFGGCLRWVEINAVAYPQALQTRETAELELGDAP